MLTPSQATILFSPAAYATAFHLALPHQPTSTRFTQTREALSAIHCSLIAILSAIALYQNRSSWLPSRDRIPNPELTAENPIVAARSEFANAITALETAYLVVDAGILLQGGRLRAQERGTKVLSQLNLRVLGWHHGGLIGAFGVLQWYIAKGREKAILIIMMLLLMNASTPFGTLYWYLANFRAGRRKVVVGSYATYLATYAVCRVYLLYWILGVFGSHINCTVVQTFTKLRLPCQLGTATIGITNSLWLMKGLRFLVRHVIGGSVKKVV